MRETHAWSTNSWYGPTGVPRRRCLQYLQGYVRSQSRAVDEGIADDQRSAPDGLECPTGGYACPALSVIASCRKTGAQGQDTLLGIVFEEGKAICQGRRWIGSAGFATWQT